MGKGDWFSLCDLEKINVAYGCIPEANWTSCQPNVNFQLPLPRASDKADYCEEELRVDAVKKCNERPGRYGVNCRLSCDKKVVGKLQKIWLNNILLSV